MKRIVLILVVLFSLSLTAQRTCSTNDKLKELQNTIPGFATHHREVMDFIYNPDNSQTLFRGPNSPAVVVTIPVVFHVLYKNSAQNISDAQILSQLTVLNNDFKKLNADFNTVVPSAFRSLGANLEITFCKATRTPTGATTTGITRKQVSSSFDLEQQYYTTAGELAWDPKKYLNVWIGRFNDPTTLGFALLPSSAGEDFDGLCIGDQFFGTTGTASAPFNKGRTATHEIGHYFGLLHPWGDDGIPCGNPYVDEFTPSNDDRVADTPTTNNPYFGCPAFPNNANACGTTANGSMFMNFMDYVNDACMAFFTTGQKAITQNTLASARLSLLTSNGCGTLDLTEVQAINAISIYPNPVTQYFMITSPQTPIDEVELYNAIGQVVKTQKLAQDNNIINIEEFATGTYYLRIYSKGQFVKSDKVIKK